MQQSGTAVSVESTKKISERQNLQPLSAASKKFLWKEPGDPGPSFGLLILVDTHFETKIGRLNSFFQESNNLSIFPGIN
jgi:hypothetical protein